MDDIFYNLDDLLNISDEELGAVIEENNASNMSIPLEVGSVFPVDGFYDIDSMKDFSVGETKRNNFSDFQNKLEEGQGPENNSENAISSDLSSDSDNRPCDGKSSILCSRMTIPGKPRNKRSRISFSSWASKPISSIASSGIDNGSASYLSANAASSNQLDCFASDQVECQSTLKFTIRKQGKEKDISGVLICTHCGVNKTPQWRSGPLGPKTLCNACGVRYKSGGLLPEYRPAASPTFSLHKHSNSSKKVLEMRRRKQLMGEKI